MSDINSRAATPPKPLDLVRLARRALRPLASLQVTVALFAVSVLLVFFGTLAQKNAGIWTVVEKYFYSWFVWVDFQMFVNFAQVFFQVDPKATSAGAFPFPAGKLIGWAMFVNLMSAHLYRFRLTWKRSGIFILHAGVMLLLVGEYVTREFQVEQRMVIEEGGASGSAFDTRDYELAFTDAAADPTQDRVTVVPAKLLIRAAETGTRITHPDLPVDIGVQRWMPNSRLVPLAAASEELKQQHGANAGAGTTRTAVSVPEVSGTDPNQQIDLPSAFVTFYAKGTDDELGRYLVSLHNKRDDAVAVGGKSFAVSLRFTQHQKPFKLTLLKFTHEKYLGTNLPKNFSSRVRIDDPERDVHREVDISMNEPLRYRGEAYFQAGFDEESEKFTVLQVVRNPGWTLPYISCFLVTLGMTVHFLIFLVQFLRAPSRTNQVVVTTVALVVVCGFLSLGLYLLWLLIRSRRVTTNPVPLTGAVKYAGLAGALLGGLWLAGNLFPASKDGKLDLSALAGVPVVEGGRLKPLDTVARVYLRRLNEREDMTTAGGETFSAMKWYLEVASGSRRDPGRAKDYPVFRIQNLEVLSLLELKPKEGWRYTLADIGPRQMKLRDAAIRARSVPEKDQTAFEAKVLETFSRYNAYLEIATGGGALTLPPREQLPWRNLATVNAAAEGEILDGFEARLGTRPRSLDELVDFLDGLDLKPEQKAAMREGLDAKAAAARDQDPDAAAWTAVLSAYRAGDAVRFETAVSAYRDRVMTAVTGGDRTRVKLELFLNKFAPYYHASILYGVALALSLIGWGLVAAAPATAQAFRRATFWLLLVTFLVHTFSLLARMYLMDRPLVFVTNLYSSAVFIGCVAAGVCLLIERIFPIGLGNLVAASLGLGTCVIGHQIAAGDTLEMMRAVLDTNFWLATHVTTVTFGYSATYIAGVIGLVYIVLGLFTPRLNAPFNPTGDPDKKPQPLGKVIGQALYGVICMATLFSFVGTVLGGIWADQSWGRFWGWDPKENGAVMIVVWNVLILHARWCGLVRNRGTAILALVGNMITTWSWFGTNQLGVGLHAYGFNNTLRDLCNAVWISHLVLIAVALSVPPQHWRSDTQKA